MCEALKKTTTNCSISVSLRLLRTRTTNELVRRGGAYWIYSNENPADTHYCYYYYIKKVVS